MSMLSELQGSKHIRPLDGRAPSVAANVASYDPQEGDNGLVLLAKLLKRMAAGILLQALPAGTAAIGSVKDNGPAWTTVRGVAGVPVNSADMTTAAAVTAAPTSGQKLVIDDILVSTDTEMSVTFLEETSGTVIRGPIYLAANSTTQITLRGLTKLPVADKKLMCDASAAGNITVEVGYHSEA